MMMMMMRNKSIGWTRSNYLRMGIRGKLSWMRHCSITCYPCTFTSHHLVALIRSPFTFSFRKILLTCENKCWFLHFPGIHFKGVNCTNRISTYAYTYWYILFSSSYCPILPLRRGKLAFITCFICISRPTSWRNLITQLTLNNL